MKDKIEAILFAAGRYLEAEYIAKLLQTDLRTVKKALSELKEDYLKREGCAIHVVQENEQWKLQVRDEYLEYASKLAGEVEISKTVLETLAVVAWKNGISQAELIKIRGPAAYEHIGELAERGFLTKVAEGRSFKLTLQQKFFDYFDVEGREDMKGLFAPIEAEKAAAQAEIDAKQSAYDAQVRAAQEAVSANYTGTPAVPTGSAPSAQNNSESTPPDLISEAKDAADKLMNPEEELVRAKEAVDSLGSGLAQLKREVLEEEQAEADADREASEPHAEPPKKHPHKSHSTQHTGHTTHHPHK